MPNLRSYRCRRPVFLLAAFVLAGCATGRNYVDPQTPRYAGGMAYDTVSPGTTGDTLRLVSFNIAFARQIDSAIAVLVTDAHLRNADVVLLQEMDEPGTRRVAAALGMTYVYYPAVFSLRSKRDFGNAVLSRWPIVEDAKIILPHPAKLAGTQRIATAATLQVRGSRVRVYSAHLGTIVDVGPGSRRDQLRVILEDAQRYPHAVVGGDMNSHGVGESAGDHGFSWPTREGPRTTMLGRWDHIFLKGMESASSETGTVVEGRNSSDHRAVWTKAVLRRPQ